MEGGRGRVSSHIGTGSMWGKGCGPYAVHMVGTCCTHGRHMLYTWLGTCCSGCFVMRLILLVYIFPHGHGMYF